MPENVWDSEYNQLLNSARKTGEFKELKSGAERRNHPRFPLKMESVWMKMASPFTVADISLSGISLLSNKPFLPGSTLQLQLVKAFQVESVVVGCDMEEADSDLLDMQYRVRCRFSDLMDTKQILVMIKEMDLMNATGEHLSG